MTTIGIGEVKQSPHEVFQRVAATGEPLDVTYHGRPVGVRIVSTGTTRSRWVSATVLDEVPTPSALDSVGLRSAVERLRNAELVVDPWEDRP